MSDRLEVKSSKVNDLACTMQVCVSLDYSPNLLSTIDTMSS